jgi:hypothetical protein
VVIPDPGGRSRGRRDNGLTASSFSSVGDVDPRVGEHLLDILALDGIAAYLQPTVDHDAVTRAVSLPAHPTDRLYVDRYRAADARALVATEAQAAGRPTEQTEPDQNEPDQHEPDQDRVWAGIVASFDLEPTEPVPRWPANEDADPDEGSEAGSEARPAAAAALDEPAEEPDEEEGYVPPPPPPLPRLSRQTAGALLTISAGVFLLLLGSRLLSLDPDIAFRLGILAVIGGVAYLIWRMRDDPSDEDRPDDGAVV